MLKKQICLGFLLLNLSACSPMNPFVSKEHYEPYYGSRPNGIDILHAGIDIDARVGTPIFAAADGVVTRAQDSAAGIVHKSVAIDHEGDISTEYLHMNTVDVKVGQKVRRGEKIGTVGQSGGNGGFQNHLHAKHPHLHFEVRKGPHLSTQNPRDYIVGCYDSKREHKPLEMIWPTGC